MRYYLIQHRSGVNLRSPKLLGTYRSKRQLEPCQAGPIESCSDEGLQTRPVGNTRIMASASCARLAKIYRARLRNTARVQRNEIRNRGWCRNFYTTLIKAPPYAGLAKSPMPLLLKCSCYLTAVTATWPNNARGTR